MSHLFDVKPVQLHDINPVRYKNIEYITEHPDCNTSNNIPERRRKRTRDTESVDISKRFRCGYDDETTIEQFLESDTCENESKFINLYIYSHIAAKPGSDREAAKCTVLGRNYRNYGRNNIQTSALAKERTRQFLCGFPLFC